MSRVGGNSNAGCGRGAPLCRTPPLATLGAFRRHLSAPIRKGGAPRAHASGSSSCAKRRKGGEEFEFAKGIAQGASVVCGRGALAGPFVRISVCCGARWSVGCLPCARVYDFDGSPPPWYWYPRSRPPHRRPASQTTEPEATLRVGLHPSKRLIPVG